MTKFALLGTFDRYAPEKAPYKMNVTKLKKNKLRGLAAASSIGFAMAACALVSPAQACSELPNIRAGQAQHN